MTCGSLPWTRQVKSHSEFQHPLVPLRLGQPPRTRNTGEPEGKTCGGQMEMENVVGQQARAGRQEEVRYLQ